MLHSNNFNSASMKDDLSAWETYTDPATGFTIAFPPQYAVRAEMIATDTPWQSRSLLTVTDPTETAGGEFHVGPAGVTLQKQPVIADGEVFHTIADYQRSGVAAQMVQGATNPDGELVNVGGAEALMYRFPQGDATDAPIDEYYFIKDDLIYGVSFNANDPNEAGMLQSISWR